MTILLQIIFWVSSAIVIYTYFGYPLLLIVLTIIRKNTYKKKYHTPSVSIIIPAYNESLVLNDKITNTINLDYPKQLLQIIVVSDASSDNTDKIIQSYKKNDVLGFRLPIRSGKAAALNLGLTKATNDVIVFTDASIFLERDALKNIVAPFVDNSIGCVSGEDSIEGSAGEGLYGRYELTLRNLESKINSIVGASGCFYAQRHSLIGKFPSGMAPDFYSVLKTVESGYRAITESNAKGTMNHVPNPKGEFQRKVRTLLRGITTLMAFKHLLSPRRFKLFSIFLWSHKIARWSCGFALLSMFVTNLFLFSPFWLFLLFLQIVFYTSGLVGWFRSKRDTIPIYMRIPLFFGLSNLATIYAWTSYFFGNRIEVWTPSKRI